jgi:hypothetical protein
LLGQSNPYSQLTLTQQLQKFDTRILVVLQKFVEDRKVPEKGISYATTPKISAMNFTRSLTAPFSTFFHLSFPQHVHDFLRGVTSSLKSFSS